MSFLHYFRKKQQWLNVAQTGERNFHLKNEWRQTEDFMNQTRYFFTMWGYSEQSFCKKTIIDLGAGSKLRSKFFLDADIIVIEPLADQFIREIAWSDLREAKKVYSKPAEEFIRALRATSDFVMCINVLDHSYHPQKILNNVYQYLKPGGEFCLSVDLHEGNSDPMHPVELTESDVMSMLKKTGFSSIRKIAEGLGERGKNYGHGVCITVISQR